jgi:ABC-type protease/lipase transport system fused ATPase/permease subunit
VTWGEAVVTLGGAVILMVGTWITARFTRKTGQEANETTASQARTADWAAFMAEQREWTERQLKEQDERTEQQLAERDRRIDRLEERLNLVEAKYKAAIAYIRRIVRQLQRHVDPEDIETPPPEISPDL